jgi:hypothetical protein
LGTQRKECPSRRDCRVLLAEKEHVTKIAILRKVEYINLNRKMLPIFYVFSVLIHLPDKKTGTKKSDVPIMIMLDV